MHISYYDIRFEVEAGVATITLDRPDAGNAIDMGLAEALVDVAGTCASDASIRCVVLTGAGKLFCAGGDVKAMAQATDRPGFLNALASTLHRALVSLVEMQKPLVTLVNGPAAGAGLSLAISGDAVLDAPNARFAAAYTMVGLTPDGGMSWLLPRVAGLRVAQRLLLRGETIEADDALRLGLVTEIVAGEELAEAGAALAARLASGPVRALGGARQLMREGATNGYEDHLDRERLRIAEAASSEEAAEGISAFAERRKPDFPRTG